MRKSTVKRSFDALNIPHSSGAVDGCHDPQVSSKLNDRGEGDSSTCLDPVSTLQIGVRRAFLDGNFARRNLPPPDREYCIWDSELPGFGLRVLPSGNAFWFVRLYERGKRRRVSLGKAGEEDAAQVRMEARRILARAMLDGMPQRVAVKATPRMIDYVDANWRDIARCWKPSTATRNRQAWARDLAPVFGMMHVADIRKTDVVRWRDDCAGEGEARFNRALPVLASLLKYAEALQLRRKGSNPCRGMPRYRRAPKERYLSPQEYRRLGAGLREAESDNPAEVAITRLLLYTGARISEIRDLQWDWVRPSCLMLPDSKTGPRTILLNRQARAIIGALPRREGCRFLFPNRSGTAPLGFVTWWFRFRRRCALPDLRIHDLRHSFASIAIRNNVPLATIGRLLGHALPETTARYAHLADDTIADAAVRVCGSLAGALGMRP